MLFFQDNVMCATLYDTGGGDERDLGLLLQLLDRSRATTAHRRDHLA